MTKISRFARKQCWDCTEPLDIRHEDHVIRVYIERKLVSYFHMNCHDHLQ